MTQAPADPILGARAQGEAAFIAGRAMLPVPFDFGDARYAAYLRGWRTAKFGATQPHRPAPDTQQPPVDALQRLQTAFDAAREA